MIIVDGRRSQGYLTIMVKSLTTNPGYCELQFEIDGHFANQGVSSNNPKIICNMGAMAEKMQPF